MNRCIRSNKGAARFLVGRKIVAVEMNPFGDGRDPEETTFNPVFTLDNGVRLRFVVDETEIGEYGIAPVLMPKQ